MFKVGQLNAAGSSKFDLSDVSNIVCPAKDQVNKRLSGRFFISPAEAPGLFPINGGRAFGRFD